jgi:hypothetical protein
MRPCVGRAKVLPPSSFVRRVVGTCAPQGTTVSAALLPALSGPRRLAECLVTPPVPLQWP